MTEPPVSLMAEAITRNECLELLEAASLARVVISVKCLPVALPARISLMEGTFIMLASTDPSVILAAQRFDVLTLQIDGLDANGLTWSVMVSGIAKIASGNVQLSPGLDDAVARGATLGALPLSVVIGQRG